MLNQATRAAMLEAIAHRGPDGEGMFVAGAGSENGVCGHEVGLRIATPAQRDKAAPR